MKDTYRDLLVLTKNLLPNEEAIEHEVESISKILMQVESMKIFCIANEIIDVNRYKVISNPLFVQQAIELKKNKPFVFISCKN